MAISTNFIGGAFDATDASSYTTASITPSSNVLTFVAVMNRIATGVAGGTKVPTVTGCGLTWVQVNTQVNGGATPNRRVTVFRACGTATSGALTIDFAGETQTNALYHVCEFPGARIDGGNGANGVVQTAGANDGNLGSSYASVWLPSGISYPGNLTYAFAFNTSAETFTVATGYTKIGETIGTENGYAALSETKFNSTYAGCSWVDPLSNFVIVAIEIASIISRPMFRKI